LQHIDPVETEEMNAPAVMESVIPPEQIEEIIDKKRQTFRIRQFDSVEFGTLTDSDQETEPEPVGSSRSFHGSDYKPPYPEDDDDFAESALEAADEVIPPCRALHLHVPADAEATDVEAEIQNTKAVAISKHRTIISHFYKQERKFRRRYLLQKIQHRLGLFAGLLQKSETQLPESLNNESDMDTRTLQEYGAAVLDGRPPFVRKEPYYAYQTSEMPVRQDVTYPDPKTGTPITLRWLPEKIEENERFGVSYTEFLNREKFPQYVAPDEKTGQPQPNSAATLVLLEPEEAPTVRTSLNASLGNHIEPSHCFWGLEESFEGVATSGRFGNFACGTFSSKIIGIAANRSVAGIQGSRRGDSVSVGSGGKADHQSGGKN